MNYGLKRSNEYTFDQQFCIPVSATCPTYNNKEHQTNPDIIISIITKRYITFKIIKHINNDGDNDYNDDDELFLRNSWPIEGT